MSLSQKIGDQLRRFERNCGLDLQVRQNGELEEGLLSPETSGAKAPNVAALNVRVKALTHKSDERFRRNIVIWALTGGPAYIFGFWVRVHHLGSSSSKESDVSSHR